MPLLSELIAHATAQLHAAGIDDGAREARILCAAMLGIDRAALMTGADQPLSPTNAAKITNAIARRTAHEPLARILGVKEFWGLEFALNDATLVPRPDSETLIEAALDLFPDRQQPLRILDLGTGSGCLLLALLHEFPQAHGIGVDIAPEAVTMAKQNAASLGLAERADFRVADWNDDQFLQTAVAAVIPAEAGIQPLTRGARKKTTHIAADAAQELDTGHSLSRAPTRDRYDGSTSFTFDLIISNPPYIASPVIPTLDVTVRHFDPAQALDGGADGLQAYRQLAGLVPHLSHAKSKIIVEIGYDQALSVPEIFRAGGHRITTRLHRDLADQPRCITINFH